ncbi:hypothetical protein BaRGS_00032660 [Batillaria attramentaria]|uniref:DUF4371 domain-containing protein n=1 Tax=Batillaria attramentaria TaxID=370345 RepID=A0ABD0JMD5_9CAEN
MASKRAHETDDEDGIDIGNGKTKRLKPAKKQTVQCFRQEYTTSYPVIRKSSVGANHVFCTACRCDISIAHGGIDDIRRHVGANKHIRNTDVAKGAQPIGAFFAPKKEDPAAEEVTRSETLLVELLVEFNLPLSAADRFTETCKKMFPDSKVATKFACGRSKATAMVRKLADSCRSELIERMKKGPFTISTDGSNDANDKMFPIVVRTLDLDAGIVQSEMLSLPFLSDRATGENIFQLIRRELEGAGIPWTNCIALGCDNANVMVGKDKGVYGFLKRMHPEMYLSGCVCHLIHISAQKASAQLAVKIDELLVDVFYYIDNCSTRLRNLKAIQVYHEVQAQKILKHVSTRWLSLRTCLPRLLENWDALREFFKQEKAARTDRSSHQNDRLERLSALFRSPTSKLYCLFLMDVLDVFDQANVTLQCETPMVHMVRRTLFKLLRSLFERFLKPVALANKSGELLKEVQFKVDYHQKNNEDLAIGEEAHAFIANGNNLRAERVCDFYKDVKKFFTAACSYILERLPLSDIVLKHAEVVDPEVVQKAMQLQIKAPEKAAAADAHVESVKFFMERFSHSHPPWGKCCSHQTGVWELSGPHLITVLV